MDYSAFPKRLKDAREAAGLRQNKLAELVNVSPQTISGYEKAIDGKLPSLDVAVELSKILNVSLDWLLGINDGKSKEKEIETIGEAVRELRRIMDSMPNGFRLLKMTVGEKEESTHYVIELQDPVLIEHFKRLEEMSKLVENNLFGRVFVDGKCDVVADAVSDRIYT